MHSLAIQATWSGVQLESSEAWYTCSKEDSDIDKTEMSLSILLVAGVRRFLASAVHDTHQPAIHSFKTCTVGTMHRRDFTIVR